MAQDNARSRDNSSRTSQKPSGFFGIVKTSAKDFSRDQCGLRAAALCYYTAFALPPLLIVLIKLAGVLWDPESVRHAFESQFGSLVGSGGATQVSQMVSSGEHASHSGLGAVVGLVGLFLGATGAFLSLQDALNAVWHVKPDPKQGGIKRFITKRLLSIGMVMGLAFLLVVSLAASALLGALGGAMGGAGIVMQAVNIIFSLAFLSVLFAAMFKFLPDAVIAWRSVWFGGVATAVLFEIGKFAIGLYLGHSNPGNAFGAASAFAVILVWIYYAGMLLLFGAEFTRNWADAHGHAIRPKSGAILVEREEHTIRDGAATSDARSSATGAVRTSNDGSAREPAPSRMGKGTSTALGAALFALTRLLGRKSDR